MNRAVAELCLLQSSRVLFLAVDELIPIHGRSVPGFGEFIATLDHHAIPSVWLTYRSRLQFDEPRRKLGHTHPFIAEDGCAVYLPEDYFHLRPESSGARADSTVAFRLGRFTCLPSAQPLPAAAETLENLSEDTGVPVVTLRSLSLRELAQNTGLPSREAELARQRDFEEIFFFAGVSQNDIERFFAEGRARKLQFRPRGILWSATIDASLQQCIRELSKLYDRALHRHAQAIGVATPAFASAFLPYCEKTLILTRNETEHLEFQTPASKKSLSLSLLSPNVWQELLEFLLTKS